MRFDSWLVSVENKTRSIEIIYNDYITAPYNPCFKYIYCELFLQNNNRAIREYKIKNKKGFEEWVLSHKETYGRVGNLSRDLLDCRVSLKEKSIYCTKFIKHFNATQKQYAAEHFGTRYIDIRKLYNINTPLNLDIEIKGIQKISLHLMAHPCFHKFDAFIKDTILPDTSSLFRFQNQVM